MNALRTPADEALPQLVRSRVALVRHGVQSVRWVQAMFLGAAAGAVALTAGVYGGAVLTSPALLFVAGLNGLAVMALWLFAHRHNAAHTAREIDRALEFGGALFTAWEVEGEPRASAIGRQLGREVAASATPSEMLRATLPATLPLLAVLFGALTLLIGVLEGRRSDATSRDFAGLARELEAGLAAVSAGGEGASDGAAAALSAVEQRDLQNLTREVAAIGESLEEGSADGEDLAAMTERLAEMETRLGSSGGQELRDGLHRAQTALDAARMAVEGQVPASPGAPESTEDGGAGSSPGSGVASGAEDGKLSRPNSPPARVPESADAGVLGLPSWPRAYDGIVESWVESARRSPPANPDSS